MHATLTTHAERLFSCFESVTPMSQSSNLTIAKTCNGDRRQGVGADRDVFVHIA